MGFRLRKSIKILPGVRMTVGTGGIGYSVGGRGLRVTRHANGRVSRTVGLPGTGLSHTSTVRAARTRPAPPRPRTPPPAAPPAAAQPAAAPPAMRTPPRPGPNALAWERDLFAAGRDGERLAGVARTHGWADPGLRVLAAALDGLHRFAEGDDPARARSLLAWVVAQGVRELPAHPFVTRYLAGQTWPVEIAGGVVAHLGLADDAVLLAAAELHQAAGDLDTAIWTVEQAEPTAPAALSLVELYSDAGRGQEVVDLTTGTTNLDDATALLLVLRGRAFAQLGYHDAARESLKEALRVRSRAAGVRHRALRERAGVNLGQNRRAAARRDLERILAEDPSHPGLTEALAAVG